MQAQEKVKEKKETKKNTWKEEGNIRTQSHLTSCLYTEYPISIKNAS
jgi:hypothetical protein